MELHELDVGHGGPGAQGHGDAVAGGLRGVRRHAEELPGTAGGQDDVSGPSPDGALGAEQLDTLDPVVTEQELRSLVAAGEANSRRRRPVVEGPLDLGARGCPSGVEHPRGGVTALSGQGQRAVGLTVEGGAEGKELHNALGALLDQDLDRPPVAEAAAGGQGVGDVEADRVRTLVHHGGDSALGPGGGGGVDRALGRHDHVEAGGGQPDRRAQARNAGADDDHVGTELTHLAVPKRAARLSMSRTPSTTAATSRRSS